MTEPWPRGRSRHGGVDEVPLPAGAGRLWLAGKHYVAPDPEQAMTKVGAGAVLCLCEEPELVGHWPAYVEWLRTDRTGRAWWYPLPDFHAPPPDGAADLVAAAVGRLPAGLLVHCGAGMGRAGTVAAAILMGLGATRLGAEGQVAAARPGAGPEAGVQRELLAALDRRPRPWW